VDASLSSSNIHATQITLFAKREILPVSSG